MEKCVNEPTVFLEGGAELSPHLFREIETITLEGLHGPVTVQVLECEKCGEVSVGWWRPYGERD